jgi:DNA-binding NarL/FixJ family response regulator
VQFHKILVVEDFSEIRRAVCSLLRLREEFQVEVASDGLEAVQKAEELRPDLVLLDIGLPKLNGMEVARRVRNLAPSAKILFLSVESDPDLVTEALRLGSGYVHKPRIESDLLRAIEAVREGGTFVSPSLEPNGRTYAPRRHELLFWSTESILLESFTRFIANALETGNAAIVLSTESHRENLIQRLKAGGIDVDGAVRRGTYQALDAAEMLLKIMSDGVPDVKQFFESLCGLAEAAAKATEKEDPFIAICCECVDLLRAVGNTHAAIQLEKAGQDLIQEHNVEMLCAYRSSRFGDGKDKQALSSICAGHTAVHFK